MADSRLSNSADASAGLIERLRYLGQLVKMNAARKPPSAADILADVEDIVARYEHWSDISAREARLLEIGFGARPHRAFAFQARVGEVVAVDLDQPIFGFREFQKALSTNGAFRAVKGLARGSLRPR